MTEKTVCERLPEALAALSDRVAGSDYEDAVKRISVQEEVHAGIPYLFVEVRSNDYGAVDVGPRGNDPIGCTAREFNLVQHRSNTPTETTDRQKLWFVPLEMAVEHGEAGAIRWDD